MKRPAIKLHPDAVEEAAEARRWYSEIRVELGEAFAAELDRAVDRIVTAPSRWPVHVHGTRCVLLDRFAYLVVYRQVKGRIQIVAIQHVKRRPGYWKDRISDGG